MRSLRYAGLREAQIDDELPITATTWDPATDSIICIFGPAPDRAVISLKRRSSEAAPEGSVDSQFSLIASWDAPCPLPDLPCDAVVSLQYFPDSLSTCIVLSGGDIIIVREDPQPGEEKIEIVGSVDAGITAAAWAPDEELLALTTRASTLLYMTRDFDNAVNVSFSVEDLKASKHVSVGWGKKETQFKGKRAKSLKDPTMPEMVDEGKLLADDDGRVTISWRGDGNFVAVNSVESQVRRVIRVYSRDGTLDSVSEPVDGLTGALSWRPAGNLIAGIQRLPGRVDVVFFERNGLRHGQFSLRLSEEEIHTWASNIDVHWNVTSSVLAVCFCDRVQMWTVGNYHYYLKQEIPIQGAKSFGSTLNCDWHLEKHLRVAITSRDRLLDVEFVSEVIRGSTVAPSDFGAVAVIDGKTLKLTLFKFSVLPPPFALVELNLEDNIVDVALSPSGRNLAVLTTKMIILYTWDPTPMSKPVERRRRARDLQLSFRFQNPGIPAIPEPYVQTLRRVFWQPDQRWWLGDPEVAFQKIPLELLALGHPLGGQTHRYHAATEDTDVFASLDDESTDRHVKLVGRSGECPGTHNVFCVMIDPVARDHDGTVTFGVPTNLAKNTLQIAFAEPGTLSASRPRLDAEGIHIGKDEERLLGNNVTSYVITGDHLIFTTSNNLLKFVHLTKLEGKSLSNLLSPNATDRTEDLEVPADTPEADERCRNIETGGTIVTVCSTDYKVILQMERGNIETIYPRALVVPAVRRFIDHGRYDTAYEVCRKHMVDMNILHDYNPSKFMSSVHIVASQLRPEDIHEFLLRLKEEDVSETLYKDTIRLQPAEQLPLSILHGNKVNRICDTMIRYLRDKPEEHSGSIVTAYVCKSPPDLESALRFIQELPKLVASSKAEELKTLAITEVCFLVDVKRLYDSALGLYDLDLAVKLAQETQMDPKEYLPWVRSLQNEPAPRRCFLLDDHLKRYEKALGWLFNAGSYQEMLPYTVQHNLYLECVEYFKYMPNEEKEIQVLFAEYLFKNSKYKYAGIVYESVEHYQNATEAYAKAHMWRQSLNCAAHDPDSNLDKIHSLASSLAQVMAAANDYRSAATIHAEYLDDILQAAKFLCRAFCFADAIALLKSGELDTSHPDLIDNGLAEAMATMTELLADCKGQLNAQVPRIGELRAKKSTDPVSYYDNAGNANADGADIPDDVSLAPTDASTAGASLFTRYTNTSSRSSSSRQTSKNRRREERKRASGKRGTIYEEEYLVASVGRLIDRVNSVNEDVGRLVAGLASRGKREEAKAIRNAMNEVVGLCRDYIEEVFQRKSTGDGEAVRPGGADGVLFDSEQEQRNPKGVVPTVKEFEAFSFLGK